MNENDELFRPSWCPGSSPMEVPVGFAALTPFIPRREVLDLQFSVQTDKKNPPNERLKQLQRIAQNVTKSTKPFWDQSYANFRIEIPGILLQVQRTSK